MAAWATLLPQPALAWENHAYLMPWALRGLDLKLDVQLDRPKPAPCPLDDREIYASQVLPLGLQILAEVPPTDAELCLRRQPISLRHVLLGFAVDEPDQGMDQDLPESADPDGDREWLGGTRGPSSRDFRHFFLGGMELRSPLLTFQIPRRPMGKAVERVETIVYQARYLLLSGQSAWGARELAWAVHYLQDLAQPFRVMQIPSVKMVPWYVALHWPPSEAWDLLVRETGRSVTNYRRAFEGYIAHRLSNGDSSSLAGCLRQPEIHARVRFDPAKGTPAELAEQMTLASTRLGRRLGAATYRFFGGQLRKTGIVVSEATPPTEYAELSIRPDLTEERQLLDRIACEALANAVVGTRKLIEWALLPQR